ncbi:MAG: hypothetical protein LBT65_08550 [Synergistaceae bacterium]|jgi:hypothetical protein|nr:hypothetical protein [Synergistaceae bacterium]
MSVKNSRPIQALRSGFKKIFGFGKTKGAPDGKAKSSSGFFPVEGKIYGIWSWILPLLLGLAVGWFGMICLGAWLDGIVRPQRSLTTAVADSASFTESEIMNMTAFLNSNPFRISSMPERAGEGDSENGEDAAVTITGDLATAVVKWTMPEIGAWIESQGKQHLILLNESFDVYTLEKVTYRQAFFRKGDEQVVKDLLFAPLEPGVTLASRPAGQSGSASAASGTQVAAADPGGKEGAISSEMVLQLMENPFDELKKVRLRPKEGEQGLEIQWINNDSILSQLGVHKGDVIRSINGIPFRNMAEITNAMSSLLNSERFDVEVTREGKPTSLKYVVR